METSVRSRRAGQKIRVSKQNPHILRVVFPNALTGGARKRGRNGTKTKQTNDVPYQNNVNKEKNTQINYYHQLVNYNLNLLIHLFTHSTH